MAIFDLPSRSFQSKGKAGEYFSELKNEYYASGPRTVVSDPIHKKLILELIENYYPEYDDLCGVGIKDIFVDKADKRGHKSTCFYVLRVDGTEENFGLSYIFKGGISDDQKFYRACNDTVLEVKEQIKRDKINAGETCQKTGKAIGSMEDAILRHIQPTFKSLFIISHFWDTPGNETKIPQRYHP